MIEVYIGHQGTPSEGYKQGLTIYKNKEIEYVTSRPYVAKGDDRYDKILDTFLWGLKQLRKMEQLGDIDVEDGIRINIESKTLYTWLKKGESPERYIEQFGEISLELSLMSVPTEIHLIEGTLARYWDKEEKMENILDVIDQMGE